MSARRRTLVAGLVVTIGLGASAINCKHVTELVVVVDTADPAAGDFDEVIITVDDQPRDETLGRELSFPLWFGVEAGSNSSALVKFSVTAKKTNRVILSDVVAMASFVKSESHVVHFTLCPCKGDGCAATYVYDDSLPEWTGSLPPPQSCTGSRDGGVEGDGGSEDGASGDATAIEAGPHGDSSVCTFNANGQTCATSWPLDCNEVFTGSSCGGMLFAPCMADAAVPVAIFRVPPGNYAVQVIAGTLTQITPACAPIAGSRCFSPALGGTTGTLSTESYFAVGVPGIPCADEDYSFRFTPIP